MNQPLRKLLALVAVILGGSALAVDGYIASRTPGKPRIERASLTGSGASELVAPTEASVGEPAVVVPCARECRSRDAS